MTGKLIVTRGLPASGKTTWAKEFCAWEPGYRVRVNRDDLRLALNGGTHGYSSGTEGVVTIAQETSARALLAGGITVVIDDQNLAMRYAKKWSKIAYEANAQFQVNDEFLSVPLEACIAHDALRDPITRVGADFIKAQYQRYGLKKGLPAVPAYEPAAAFDGAQYYPDPSLPDTVLVDIDGTVAQMDGRDPHDYHLVNTDKPRPAVVEAVRIVYDAGLLPVFVSGRPESSREDTQRWLIRWLGAWAGRMTLFMRPNDDHRPDYQVKLEIFNREIRDNYRVLWAYDDRQQVVDMYRSIGLDVFQVAPGNF